MTTLTNTQEKQELINSRNLHLSSLMGDLTEFKGFLNEAFSDKLFKMINDKKGTKLSQEEFDLILYNFKNLLDVLDYQEKINND